jgi:hypothetical protein
MNLESEDELSSPAEYDANHYRQKSTAVTAGLK